MMVMNEGQATEYSAVTLNGKDFQIRKFSVLEALRLQTILLKKLGPAFAKLFGSLMNGVKDLKNPIEKEAEKQEANIGQSLLDMDISENVLGEFVDLLFTHIDENNLIDLISTILRRTECLGHGPVMQDLDKIFSGSTLNIYKLVIEVLKYNYQDFLSLMANSSNLTNPIST